MSEVLDDFHSRLQAGEPFREAWAAANGMPSLFDNPGFDIDTIRACWKAVNTCIAKGPLLGDGCDQTAERNGLILATNILASMLPDWEADPGQELREDEIRMVSNPGSEVPDWFRKVMLDNGFRSYSPPVMDAVPMTKAEIIMRREEAIGMQQITIPHGFYDDLLRKVLMRRGLMAPKPADQEAMYLEVADSFYPDDTEPMSRADIRKRRREAIEMYRAFRFYKALGEHNYRVLTGHGRAS